MMKHITPCLLVLVLGSTAAAQSLVGDWYGAQSSYHFHEDASYENAVSIDNTSGTCGLRLSRKSSGTWAVHGATLTLEQREGATDSVNTCNGQKTRTILRSETEALRIRFEGDALFIKSPTHSDEERYRKRVVPGDDPGKASDLSGTWSEWDGQAFEIRQVGNTLQVRLASGYTFEATGDGSEFKSNDLNAICNIDRLPADQLRFYCTDRDFVATRRR